MATANQQNGTDAQHVNPGGISTKWVLVGVLFVIGMVNYGVRTSVAAVFPLLKTNLGFTDVGLGAIGSFFLWSYALASPLAGHLGDRFDRGRVVLWSLVGWSAVTVACGLVHTRWELLTLRVLLGIIESLFLPAGMALVADYHPEKTRGTALGIMSVGQYVGLIGGATLVGFLADRWGWRPSFWVLGVAGLIIAVPSYFLLPRKHQGPTTKPSAASTADAKPREPFLTAIMHLVKIPSFLVIATAGTLTAIGVWIFLNWLPLYFKEAFSLSLASAGFLGATPVNIGGVGGQVIGGLASDRVARKGPHYRLLLQAVLILASAPILLVFVWSKSLMIIVAALTLNSVLRVAGDLNMLPLLCDLAGPERFAIAFGVTNMVNCLAGGMGIFVAGALKSSHGLVGTFAGIFGILMLDAVILLIGYGLFLKRDLRDAAIRDGVVAATAPVA